jgi:hypothetical protein
MNAECGLSIADLAGSKDPAVHVSAVVWTAPIQQSAINNQPFLLVQIEISRRLGDRLVLRLPQRFLEAPGQRVASCALGGH